MGDEEKEQGAAKNGRRRPYILAGLAAAVSLIILGAWLFRIHVHQPSAKPTEKSVIGMVDLQKALKEHNAYSQLDGLRKEYQTMAADLAMDNQEEYIFAPQVDAQPFMDAAEQKQALQNVDDRGRLMAQLREAEKAQRAATQPAYQAEKDEIDASYLNEIFNIRLKLDNAQSMRLSQDDIDTLQTRLMDLQHERGQRQYALDAKYEASIRSFVQGIAARNDAQLRGMGAQNMAKLQSEEAKKQTAAQERDTNLMQQKLQDSAQRGQRIAQKKADLQAKKKEIEALEDHMLKEIAGKASKLAILHHLTLILANPAANVQYDNRLGTQPNPAIQKNRYLPVVSVDTLDLTDELIDELQ